MSSVMEMWQVTFWRVKNLSITVMFHTPLCTTVLTCPIINKTSSLSIMPPKTTKTKIPDIPWGMIMTSLSGHSGMWEGYQL